jgi:hypothetical protein
MSTGTRYEEYDETREESKMIEEWLEKTLPNKETRKYVLVLLASSL